MTTHSIAAKVVAGILVTVGYAGTAQWRFQHQSTLVPAAAEEVARGLQTYRVHAPQVDAANTTVTIDLLDLGQEAVGTLIDVKSNDRPPEKSGRAPSETVTLTYLGRTVTVRYEGRTVEVGDGKARVLASFDRRDAAEAARLAAFADDLRLIAAVQAAARPVLESRAAVRATMTAGAAFPRAATLVPASWRVALTSAWARRAGFDEGPTCHMEAAHLHCGGSFATSKSLGCAYAQQEANNECADASGWCIGCCGFSGSGCDCSCLFDDLACMCEACGGTCGPPAISPAPAATPSGASRESGTW